MSATVEEKWTEHCECKHGCPTSATITRWSCGCVTVKIHHDSTPGYDCTDFSGMEESCGKSGYPGDQSNSLAHASEKKRCGKSIRVYYFWWIEELKIKKGCAAQLLKQPTLSVSLELCAIHLLRREEKVLLSLPIRWPLLLRLPPALSIHRG